MMGDLLTGFLFIIIGSFILVYNLLNKKYIEVFIGAFTIFSGLFFSYKALREWGFF